MAQSTKIDFQYNKARDLDDITDIVAVLFPGNRNQQYAAARILLALKGSKRLVRSFKNLREQYGISRRTIERTRAKLSRLGMIERISWMNNRYHGDYGFKLSSRMSSTLRALAEKLDGWRSDIRPARTEKDMTLITILQGPKLPDQPQNI